MMQKNVTSPIAYMDSKKSPLAQDLRPALVRSSLTNPCRQGFTEILQFAALPTFATQRFGCALSAIVRGMGVAQMETMDSAPHTSPSGNRHGACHGGLRYPSSARPMK